MALFLVRRELRVKKGEAEGLDRRQAGQRVGNGCKGLVGEAGCEMHASPIDALGCNALVLAVLEQVIEDGERGHACVQEDETSGTFKPVQACMHLA